MEPTAWERRGSWWWGPPTDLRCLAKLVSAHALLLFHLCQELDDAARRRLVKRLYIPLPDEEARTCILARLLGKERHSVSEEELRMISEMTEGYSGADMANLCREAAYGPIR